MPRTYWVETLGCPKNQVDSDKLTGTILAEGMVPADAPESADLVVVNTCAFIEEARQESVDTVLALADARRDGSRLVVTGCMAERYGDELADALHDEGVLIGDDAVVGFGVPVTLGPRRTRAAPELRPVAPAAATRHRAVGLRQDRRGLRPQLRLLRHPHVPWPAALARHRRHPSRGRRARAREIVLVAQDLASFGRDQGQGDKRIVPLVRAVTERVDWVRLLYLYPSDLTDELIGAVLDTGVPYFDLSLQHVSRPLMRRMRRWGDGQRFLDRIAAIRASAPDAAFRTNFIVGYPGETEADHDELLAFVAAAGSTGAGSSRTHESKAPTPTRSTVQVPSALVAERLAELRSLQDQITAAKRDELIGSVVEVLVDAPEQARSFREAPEIDGTIAVPADLPVGQFATVEVTDALGPDLVARTASLTEVPT